MFMNIAKICRFVCFGYQVNHSWTYDLLLQGSVGTVGKWTTMPGLDRTTVTMCTCWDSSDWAKRRWQTGPELHSYYRYALCSSSQYNPRWDARRKVSMSRTYKTENTYVQIFACSPDFRVFKSCFVRFSIFPDYVFMLERPSSFSLNATNKTSEEQKTNLFLFALLLKIDGF